MDSTSPPLAPGGARLKSAPNGEGPRTFFPLAGAAAGDSGAAAFVAAVGSGCAGVLAFFWPWRTRRIGGPAAAPRPGTREPKPASSAQESASARPRSKMTLLSAASCFFAVDCG